MSHSLPQPPFIGRVTRLEEAEEALRRILSYLVFFKKEVERQFQGVDILTTAELPAGSAAMNGRILIEDAGVGDVNLIVYARNQRYRIDGGVPV